MTFGMTLVIQYTEIINQQLTQMTFLYKTHFP